MDFYRLEDNRVLTFTGKVGYAVHSLSPASAFIRPVGLFNLSKERSYTTGPLGEALPLSSSVRGKTFTLEFASGDPTGADQLLLTRFWSKDGWYRLEGPEYGVPSLEFTVVDVEESFFDDVDRLSVICQARYGDFTEETSTILASTTLDPDEKLTNGMSGSYHNTTGTDATFRVTLSYATTYLWRPMDITIDRDGEQTVKARVGEVRANGNLYGWHGKEFSLDSKREVISGHGIILPVGTTFFTIPDGQTALARLHSFTNINAQPMAVKLEAVTVRQAFDPPGAFL